MKEELLSLTHTGDEYDKYLHAVVPPVFMNSLHVFERFEDYCNVDVYKEDSFIYGRCSNPTTHILERKLAELEHGVRAVAFSSGMAAASAAILGVAGAGSHIVCMKDVYQPVKRFLKTVCVQRLNMTVTYVRGERPEEFEQAIQPDTALIILESPATFVFRVTDLSAVAQIARGRGVKTYMDNTCLTPLFQKPLDLGIDIVMHTMSKYIGGHSDLIGGVLVTKDEELARVFMGQMREWLGGVLGPMESWLAIRGIRTLAVRMKEHERTGMAVAGFLEGHERVRRVYYTGLRSHPQRELIERQQKGHSSLMSLELDCGPEQAVKMIDSLHLFGKGCSWGGYESLALTPLYTADQEELDFLMAPRGLIRLYCGLEGADNLIEDLDSALRGL